jgi:hypothetical protein
MSITGEQLKIHLNRKVTHNKDIKIIVCIHERLTKTGYLEHERHDVLFRLS